MLVYRALCRQSWLARSPLDLAVRPHRSPGLLEMPGQLTPLGALHFRNAMAEYVEHYHRERNHQGLENRLISGQPAIALTSRLRLGPQLGGLLNFCQRAA